MTIIFKDYKNLKFNEIESLLFNLCPIYRVPGLKPHKRPRRIFEQKCFIREIKNIDDDEVEIPARVQYKTDRWPLTKNKKNVYSRPMCWVGWNLQSHKQN